MKRKFSPQLDCLESRELLSSITMYEQNSAFSIGCDASVNGAQNGTSASFDSVVGANYGVEVYQQNSSKIASVTYTFPNSLNGDGGTGYNVGVGKSSYRESMTQTPLSWGFLPVHEFFDATAGVDTIKADVKYDSSNGLPDDIYTVAVNVYCPTATLSAVFPPATGPNAYGLHPTTSDNQLIPWGSQSVGNFTFGVGAPGAEPFQFWGTGENTTPVAGYFFLSQVATPTNVSGKGFVNYGKPLAIPYTDNVSSSNVGLDEWPSSNVTVPLSAYGHAYYAKANNSTYTIVGLESDDPSSRAVTSFNTVQYQFNYNVSFTTHLCFQAASGGIPIAISHVDWSIAANYYNQTASILATTTSATQYPQLWTGSSTVTVGATVNNQPRLYPSYNYNVTAFFNGTVYPESGATVRHRGHHSVGLGAPLRVDYSPSIGGVPEEVPADWHVRHGSKVIHG